MTKKKVVYVLHGLSLGGVEVALVTALPKLSQEFNIKVICLGDIEQSLISHLSNQEKNTLISFSYHPLKFPITLIAATRLILNFQPDVLICSLWRASLVGIILKNIRTKIHFFSFIHSTKTFHLLDKIFTRLAVSVADEILVDSRATHDFVISKFSPRKHVKIVSFFTNNSPKQKQNAQLHKEKEIKFMFLGRIHEVKNIPLAIDFINNLHLSGLRVSLDIYGEDSGALVKVLTYIKEKRLEDIVYFKGQISPFDKEKIFGQYHFLIQLSFVEGMAMSVAEAMQNGLVCIVNPVGEISNYSEDMVTSIFVFFENSTEWYKSVNKVISVINDINLYEMISNRSFESMKNVVTYTDSLIDHINTY